MGKFRVKPTRVVAKPFKSVPTKYLNKIQSNSASGGATKIEEDDSDYDEDIDEDDVKIAPAPKMSNPLGGILLTQKTGKISKKSKQQKLKKKSVSFSKNLTEVAKKTPGGKEAEKRAKIVKDILSKSSVSIVPSSVIKGKGQVGSGSGPGHVGLYSSGTEGVRNVNKIIKKEIKEKKSRMKARREVFKKKLELIKSAKEEQKAAKKREKTVIVGDLQPMSKILDELHEAIKPSETKAKSNTKKIQPPKKLTKLTVKKRQQEMLDGLNYFKNAGL